MSRPPTEPMPDVSDGQRGLTPDDVPLEQAGEPIPAFVGRRPRSILASSRLGPAGLLGAFILIVIVVLAAVAPLVSPFDPLTHDPEAALQRPGSVHWFGTDEFGRDLFSRILYGARTSLIVGVLAVLIGAGVGIPCGLVAGYFGRWTETVLMRFWDLFLAFPVILLAIAVLAIIGPGTIQSAFVIALGQMPIFARLTHSVVLTERQLDYVRAARVLGASNVRVMWYHILRNALPPLLVQFSLAMAFAVLLEAGLSFLGLGTAPPTPSWGGMLDDARGYLALAPWYGVFPGVAIALLVFALTYFGDALRFVVDPRSHRG